MIKIYPSASAFAQAGKCITQYSSGCFRMIVAKANGFVEPFNPIYTEVGDYDETEFLINTIQSGRFPVVLWETPFRKDLGDGVVLSGRRDFCLLAHDSLDWITVEKKSTISRNTIYAMRREEFKLGQLAQLVAYLVEQGLNLGYLVVSGWKFCKKTDKLVRYTHRKTKEIDEKKFPVAIEEDGNIMFNNRLSGFKVQDYVEHLFLTKKYLTNDELPDKPIEDGGYSSPCYYCKLKEVCKQVDENQLSREEFLRLAQIKSNELMIEEGAKHDSSTTV